MILCLKNRKQCIIKIEYINYIRVDVINYIKMTSSILHKMVSLCKLFISDRSKKTILTKANVAVVSGGLACHSIYAYSTQNDIQITVKNKYKLYN